MHPMHWKAESPISGLLGEDPKDGVGDILVLALAAQHVGILAP